MTNANDHAEDNTLAATTDSSPRSIDGAPRSQPKSGTPWGTYTGRVISLVSRKGGVGKTTTAVNLGATFALSGHTVLLVGVDPQCGIARSFGHGKYDLASGLLDVFQDQAPLTHVAHATPLDNLFFVTPNVWTLSEEEKYRRFMDEQIDTFVRAIDRARNLYDTILIDCPPGLGAETRAALLASDSYLVPVQAEELCRDSLGRLLAFIQSFRERVFSETTLPEPDDDATPLTMEGMFLTMSAPRTRAGRQVTTLVTEEYGPSLFDAVVPRSASLAEMALRGKPTVIYDRRSSGSRAYFDLMDEIITRFHARNVRTADGDPLASGAAGGSGGESMSGDGGRALSATGGLSAFSTARSARLLSELHASLPDDEDGSWGTLDTAASDLEMVSLDDLLAEEERAIELDEEWDTPSWERRSDHGDRLH